MIPATLKSEEAERGTLGSMILQPEMAPETIDTLSADSFTTERHRRFFLAIKEAASSGGTVDMVSTLTTLREAGKLKDGDATHLAELTSWSFIPSLSHCRTVARLARARSFLQELDMAKNSLLSGLSLDSVIETFAPAIQQTSQIGSRTALLRDVVADSMKAILERADNGGCLPGLSTGFDDIDNLTGGLIATNFIVLAARPAMGKTTLALNIAESVARSGMPVAFFSMEMSRNELTEKIIARAASTPLSRLRDGSLTSPERTRVKQAAASLREIPLFLHDQPGLSIHRLNAAVKGLHMRHSLGLVIVDYIGLMKGEGSTREQEVASLSRGLKSLAMEMKIPVMALSQLNRGVESRTGKKPTLADLRDSGSIEQDANIVAFIYRDEVYNAGQNNPHRGIAEFIVAKNRSGPTGTIKLGTNRLSYSEFTALSHR